MKKATPGPHLYLPMWVLCPSTVVCPFWYRVITEYGKFRFSWKMHQCFNCEGGKNTFSPAYFFAECHCRVVKEEHSTCLTPGKILTFPNEPVAFYTISVITSQLSLSLTYMVAQKKQHNIWRDSEICLAGDGWRERERGWRSEERGEYSKGSKRHQSLKYTLCNQLKGTHHCSGMSSWDGRPGHLLCEMPSVGACLRVRMCAQQKME